MLLQKKKINNIINDSEVEGKGTDGKYRKRNAARMAVDIRLETKDKIRND